MKGWGPKSSVCPSKPRESNAFWRDIPGCCRDIPEAPEKFEKKTFGFNFWPQVFGCAPQGSYSNTRDSKKDSEEPWEGFWGRVLRRFLRRGLDVGFTVKRVLRRVLRRGPWKGVQCA